MDFSASFQSSIFMVFDFGALTMQEVNVRGVTQDGSAPTLSFTETQLTLNFFMPSRTPRQRLLSLLGFDSLGRKNPDVLVIGVGGEPRS